MKFTFIIIFLTIWAIHANAQIESYVITKNDTIQLTDISFKKTAALYYSNAIILIDRDLFINKLKSERKGLKRQIKSRERLVRKKNDKIILNQLQRYKRQFSVIDSVFTNSKRNKSDTIYVNQSLFAQAGSPFGDFLPSLLENGGSIVLDLNKNKQTFIIKQSGHKRTGTMTAVGSSFYFIPGASLNFWSKMDWIS